MSVTNEQKNIYNQHLSTYKRRQNKPYTLRENFDDFEAKKAEDYVNLMKLEKILGTHNHINRRLYFEAPYEIYTDKNYFDLQFYTTMAAIKTYNLYTKQLNAKKPDCRSQIEFINESLMFIKDFCIEYNISLLEYLNFRKVLTLSWATHIAEYKISPYVLLGFEYFKIRVYDLLFNMPEDERELFVEDIINNYMIYKDNLKNSKLAKRLIIEGLKKIEIIINQNLKST